MQSVLFVCHANTARSVMAHLLLERLLAERAPGLPLRVRSGGVAAYARDGMLPSLGARVALAEVGIVVGEADFRSTDLRRHGELVAGADVIVTMTSAQKALVAGLAGADGRRVVTLRELAGESGDIGDPAGEDDDVFRACRDEIARCLERALPGLVRSLGAPC